MKIGCALMSALTVFSMVACGGGDDSSSTPNAKKHDTETRPVVFSTDALDGNFNPFFATSATDTTIAAMTQVAMLTTDAKGNPLCGKAVWRFGSRSNLCLTAALCRLPLPNSSGKILWSRRPLYRTGICLMRPWSPCAAPH